MSSPRTSYNPYLLDLHYVIAGFLISGDVKAFQMAFNDIRKAHPNSFVPLRVLQGNLSLKLNPLMCIEYSPNNILMLQAYLDALCMKERYDHQFIGTLAALIKDYKVRTRSHTLCDISIDDVAHGRSNAVNDFVSLVNKSAAQIASQSLHLPIPAHPAFHWSPPRSSTTTILTHIGQEEKASVPTPAPAPPPPAAIRTPVVGYNYPRVVRDVINALDMDNPKHFEPTRPRF